MVEQIHPACAYKKANSRQKQASNITWFMSCQQILPCYCHSTSTHLKTSKQTQLSVCKIIFLEAFCEHPKEECTGKVHWRYQLLPHLQQDDNTPNMLLSSLKVRCLQAIAGFSHIKRAVSNLLLFHRAASITIGKNCLQRGQHFLDRHFCYFSSIYKQSFPPIAHLERECSGRAR